MKKLLATTAAALAVVLAAVSLSAGSADETSAAPVLDAEEQAFITLINNYRVSNGRVPLLIDPDIDEAAVWMSTDMGVKGYFSHIDSLGRTPWDRMCHYGYCYSTAKGENIAAGFTTAQSVFTAWQNSPGHNNNMLGTNFRVMGIARVHVPGSPYGYYWTNDFGGYIAPPVNPPAPTATPAPTAPPTPVSTPTPGGCNGDADCDTWSDWIENFVGTDRSDACSNTSVRNDEFFDAFPPDVNDDRTVNSLDTSVIIPALNSRLGQARFNIRFDLNADGAINTHDIGRLVQHLNGSC